MPRPLRPILRFGAALLLALPLTTFPMPCRAIEEPDYQVVRELPDIEVRQYAAYTVAEVVVAGPADEAGKQGFPILAAYIFGKNKGGRKLAMTAPATQAAVPVELTQISVAGGFVVQFVLPKGVTVADAPEPLDARVRLREMSPGPVAVIRYSGLWSVANYNDHLARLQDALRSAGLKWTTEPVYSGYDAPFTPWFMRHNEIWLYLVPAS